MIRIICGGKKNANWTLEAISEYEKRLKKPYDLKWEFYEEEKLLKKLTKWPFEHSTDYVICCDERGKNISSDEYSALLEGALENGKNVVILIGGAYGFTPEVREKSDYIWSFSKLVFPHALARVIATEQIYRAQEIAKGSHYHHS